MFIGGPVLPVANFSASPTKGKVPLTVNFIDKSIGLSTSWKWSFGDGDYITSKIPVNSVMHTYENTGNYKVSLTVKNQWGSDKETKSKYIAVTASPPVANFNVNLTEDSFPLDVKFTDLLQNAIGLYWNFGD